MKYLTTNIISPEGNIHQMYFLSNNNFRSRGKRMSAKLKAMKKARRADFVENEVKWKPGERLRDRGNFRKIWLEERDNYARKAKKAKPHHPHYDNKKQGEITIQK